MTQTAWSTGRRSATSGGLSLGDPSGRVAGTPGALHDAQHLPNTTTELATKAASHTKASARFPSYHAQLLLMLALLMRLAQELHHLNRHRLPWLEIILMENSHQLQRERLMEPLHLLYRRHCHNGYPEAKRR